MATFPHTASLNPSTDFLLISCTWALVPLLTIPLMLPSDLLVGAVSLRLTDVWRVIGSFFPGTRLFVIFYLGQADCRQLLICPNRSNRLDCSCPVSIAQEAASQ